MVKKIWLSMHPRNFGFAKIVRTCTCVRPPLHVCRGEILHFNYARFSAVNRIDTRTLKDKKTTAAKPILCFYLILMSTLTSITEKELERETKKEKRPFALEE